MTIIVEGVADTTFIEQYLEQEIGLKSSQFKFKEIKGNIEAKRNAIKHKLEQQEQIEKWYIICDADDKKDLYTETIENILEEIKDKDEKLKDEDIDKFIENNLFLFPNNKDKGDLEDLIEQILKDPEGFQKCFESYDQCLKTKKFKRPDLKDKIYSYDYCYGGKGKENKRNYKDTNLYNLKHPALDKLKDFCEKIKSNTNEDDA